MTQVLVTLDINGTLTTVDAITSGWHQAYPRRVDSRGRGYWVRANANGGIVGRGWFVSVAVVKAAAA